MRIFPGTGIPIFRKYFHARSFTPCYEGIKTMEKDTISIFKPSLWVLVVVLVPATCRYENPYTLKARYDLKHMILDFQFEKPFKGHIFADGYRFVPDCGFRAPPLSTLRKVTLYIDLSTCGTRVDFQSYGLTKVENTVIIQQHNILGTSNDRVELISCMRYSCESFRLLNHAKSGITSSKITSQLELKSAQKALGTKLASELQLFNKPLLTFSVPNNGHINDIYVKNCIIHEKMILDDKSFFYQITHPSGCQNTSSDVMSAFSVVNNTESGNLVAYAELKPSDRTTEHGVLITCGAQLCKRTCRRKCPKKSGSDVVHSVASHTISKRSIGSSFVQPSQRESDIRNSLLKSTIKVLSQKLIQQAKSQNDTRFGRRLLSFEQTERSKIPVESSNFTNSDEAFSPISYTEYDVALLNMTYNDLDDKEQLKEDDHDDSLITISTLPERTSKANQKQYGDKFRALKSSLKTMNELLKGIEKRKRQEALEKQEVDALKKDNAENFNQSVNAVKKHKMENPEESKDSETSTDAFTDFDLELYSELVRNRSSMKPIDTAQFEMTKFDQTSTITLLPTSPLPQDVKEAAKDELTTISDLKLETQDSKSQNESESKDLSLNLNTNRSTKSNNERSFYHSCVPKQTFVIVLIVLVFIIFTLALVCCGMILYTRKEKKRHRIDNFLLYSFY